MNHFISEYLSRVRELSDEHDVRSLYHWFWHNQAQIETTAKQINSALRLTGKRELKPDLPCLTVGSTSGLLILAANPGWREDLNAKENAYCKESKAQYAGIMLDFFERHPIVVGKQVRWWANTFWFVRLLKNGTERFGTPQPPQAKWERAHESKIIGGWELFPFHSESDGISPHILGYGWLENCAIESIRAAIRFRPEVLFIASKVGWQLVRHKVFPELSWKDCCIRRSKSSTSLSRVVLQDGGPEIIAISQQIFAGYRPVTNQEILDTVNCLRGQA